jgi:subtilisin family serine protease
MNNNSNRHSHGECTRNFLSQALWMALILFKSTQLAGTLCVLLLFHSLVLGQRPALPEPSTAPAETDLVLTLRLSPNVKLSTIELLNEVTVPRQLRLEKNENVARSLSQIYGDFLPRIEERLRILNPSIDKENLKTMVATSPLELRLPAGAEYYRDVIKPTDAVNNLKEQALLETGSASQKTINEIVKRTELLKNYFRNYCRDHICTQLQKTIRIPNKAIVFPYVSRYVSYTIKPEARARLSEIENILKTDAGVFNAEIHSPAKLISHVSAVELTSSPCDPLPSSTDWFMNSIGFNKLPLETLRGQNEITIAIMDSGIAFEDQRFSLWQNIREVNGLSQEDDDLNGYIDDRIGCNFISQGEFPIDDQFSPSNHSHGTHVAGLATGRFLGNPLGQAVDQRVRAMILKIADSSGFVDNGAVNDAIVYAQNKNAKVVNMSFEGDFSASIKRYIKEDEGRLYVVAAGNGDLNKHALDLDSDVRRFPAKLSRELDNVISVAAHDEVGKLACFSNFGRTNVDLAAPGVAIQSTVVGGGMLQLNGTSQAAPLVSLTSALLFSQGLSEPSLVKQRILVSVDFVPEYRGKLSSEGKLNAAKALSIFDDVIELNDAERTILRGKFVSPPVNLQVGNKLIPFKSIKKIVNFTSDSGETLQRLTVLNQGRLEHLYERFDLPRLVLKVGDTCLTLVPAKIRDVVPALHAAAQPPSCPN